MSNSSLRSAISDLALSSLRSAIWKLEQEFMDASDDERSELLARRLQALDLLVRRLDPKAPRRPIRRVCLPNGGVLYARPVRLLPPRPPPVRLVPPL